MLVQRNMQHVNWAVRNLQMMLKAMGAVRNHVSPHYDTLKKQVTGRQVAELAIDKYHFKGTLSNPKAIAEYREQMARAKFSMVGAKLSEDEVDELKERLDDQEFDALVQTRRINEFCEALAILAHSDIFKRPPWCAFASANDPLDKHTWSLPPDFE